MESGVKGTPRRLSQGGGEIYRVSLIRKGKRRTIDVEVSYND